MLNNWLLFTCQTRPGARSNVAFDMLEGSFADALVSLLLQVTKFCFIFGVTGLLLLDNMLTILFINVYPSFYLDCQTCLFLVCFSIIVILSVRWFYFREKTQFFGKISRMGGGYGVNYDFSFLQILAFKCRGVVVVSSWTPDSDSATNATSDTPPYQAVTIRTLN